MERRFNLRLSGPRAFGALGGVLLAGLGAPARAADTAPAVQSAQAPVNIEEVVVTARRRTERLLDVPVAANSLSAQTLARYATADLTSAGAQIPQVSFDHVGSGSGAIITIRGVGSASVDESIEQEVTVNIDGVSISRGRVLQQASFDEASIEVLKGPQALYFGKNSPAGVISITSENPSTSGFSGYARTGYEFDSREYYGEGALGGPITDTLSARLAFRASQMDGGYIRDVGGPITAPAQLPGGLAAAGITLPGSPYTEYPGNQDLAGRLTVVFKPNDRFDATVKALASDNRDRGDGMDFVLYSCAPGETHTKSIDYLTFGAVTDPYSVCNTSQNHQRVNSEGTIPAAYAAHYPDSNGGIPYTEVKTYLASLTMNYRLTDDLTLTSVSGFYKFTQNQFSDYDFTDLAMAAGVNDDGQTSYSQELRLASSFHGPLNFTAGAFYGYDKRYFYQQGFIGYFGADPTTGLTNDFASDDFFTGSTYSAFGELNWKIAPDLELAGGARVTEEHKTGNTGQTFVTAYLVPFQIAAPVGKRFIGAFNDSNVSPQVTLSWHPAQDVMLYAAYKTGYKSGGFSAPGIIPATATVQNQEFAPETVTGYEAGLKFSRLDHRLTGDIALYDYTYHGLQLTAFNAATTSYFTQNAGTAGVHGAEVNLSYAATPELSVHGSAGYNHARYDSFDNSQCWTGQAVAQGCVGGVQNLTGAPLSRAPDWSLLGGASYDHPLSGLRGGYSLGVTVDAKYSSGYFLATNNNPYGWQPDYWTMDASLRVHNGVWDFALIGKNLTDTFYAVAGGDRPLGQAGDTIAELGRPRQIILQITRHF